MSRQRAVTVIGMGDDGCLSLTSRAMNAVTRAGVLAGGARHLAFFPEFEGERIVLGGGLAASLARIAALAEEARVCVLASGDPLFFGIAQRIIEAVGAAHVEVLPQPSSVQWAFARTGMKWDDAAVVSVHGRSREGFSARLRAVSKAAVLTDRRHTPQALAAHLLAHEEAGWEAWVCESLGSAEERV
ncbi:MAG TPA: precorrin-6y C5,15-methyltransferase (decarboxylating) subunit CbiE, partial [Myxococcota bacterium]|nr:precorrin-6y C5,15-methyltransferase (decarboxylating) subunit CbiE [Myxococcota bacterium]